MGRKRKHNTDLPKHRTFSHGTIYYIVPAKFQHLFSKKWEPLGKTRIDAHRKFASLPIHEEVNIRNFRTIKISRICTSKRSIRSTLQ